MCVTEKGGDKGGESRGARERERAAGEEGGREADPPTWGALASRSSLAGAASHLGRPTSADTLAAAALGLARTAPGGCAQWRQRPPAAPEPRPPASARRAPLRGLGPRPRSLPKAHAAAAPRAHHGGSARRVPACRRPPGPQRRLRTVRRGPQPLPFPRPARASLPAAAVYGAAPLPGSCTETFASGFSPCFSALASST